MDQLFFYGTLQDPELLSIVLGTPEAGLDMRPASLPDHRVTTVRNAPYPALVPQAGAAAPGQLVRGVTAEMRARLDFFEGEFAYALVPRDVQCDGRTEPALVYLSDGAGAEDADWRIGDWAPDHRAWFLEVARETMGYFGQRSTSDLAALRHGIAFRALARRNAASEAPSAPSTLDRRNVTLTRLERPYANYFAVEEIALRHDRFDGGTAQVDRAVMAAGDAVTLLPWDPKTDRLLFIEQFRPGPFARGDLAPWIVEVVAGRIDANETPEDTARREAREEAGIGIGRIAHIASYYSSTGTSTEYLHSYVGEADLKGAGGLFGADGEGEDIRAFTLSRAEAMEMAAAGQIRNVQTLLSLYWLEGRAAGLRTDWGADTAP
ncbi:gamma-glutamylcyclotransferase [Oceanomicrobium pacificus]|uniref:ADP-ribose pyrophosphatase n=1 Tax=Oceanomicrobium pacificus TaxID=2692916 RepID=A0A6B0TUV1_9RHOB|nr:gamma-glutamylcyclotransferase [Oceanomicrobium pacificus]MXU66589.1 NUDIX domain-containing protein [Oceanomicrobium pacificus]